MRPIRSLRRPTGLVLALMLLSGAAIVVAAGSSGATGVQSLSVTPAADLIDGQVVQVAGSNFVPNGQVVMAVCEAGAIDRSGCDLDHDIYADTDTTGSFVHSFTIPRELRLKVSEFEFTTVDCATTTCALGAVNLVSGEVGPLTLFDLTYADPNLAVSITSVGTLQAGTNLAVVHATVTCDHTTPISVYGTVSQPLDDPDNAGIQGVGYVPGTTFPLRSDSTQTCTPSQPLLIILATRNSLFEHINFATGPARVEIQAEPFVGFFADRPSTVTSDATVTLLDADAIRTAIVTLLAVPANTELRAAVVHAIEVGLTQDPDYRLAFTAELHGH